MHNKLKSAFKSTPERFSYTVDSAVNEAMSRAEAAAPKKRLSKAWRAVIAVALIAALVPTSVFGATKLYGLIAKPVDNYGVAIGLDQETVGNYPEYVKMQVEIPEGFAEVPGNEGHKFYSLSAKEPYTDGFSLVPMRFSRSGDMEEYIGHVESYEKRTVDGHQAYEIEYGDGGFDRLYVYYEDVNVFLLIYHKDVTDAQLESFVKGITFTEGTPSDFTYLDMPYDERDNNIEVDDEPVVANIELPRDTVLTHVYAEDDAVDLPYTSRITNIRFADSVSGLDAGDFNKMYDLDEITDSDGKLLPRTVTVTDYGDGFIEKHTVIDSYEAEQVLILADITYENLSDTDISSVFVDYMLNTMDEGDDGKLTNAQLIDKENEIIANEYCDSEIFYLTPHGTGLKDFYCFYDLAAHSSKTVTVGFRCNKDQLDKAYLRVYDTDSITDPALADHNPYTSYYFKVQ